MVVGSMNSSLGCSVRERWLKAVQDRLTGDGGPHGLLSPDALTEAVELFAHTTRFEDMSESCRLVGLLHWHRSLALGDKRAHKEVLTAVSLLQFVVLTQPHTPLPDPVPQLISPRSSGLQAVFGGSPSNWDHLLMMLEPWLSHGVDPHSLRLAASAGRNAANSASSGSSAQTNRQAFVQAAQLRLFDQTGDVSILKEVIATSREMAGKAKADTDRARHQYNLAESLRAWFQHSGDLDSLWESIEFTKHVLRVTPNNSAAMHGLSTSLRLLSAHTDDSSMLDEAFALSTTNLDSVPGDHSTSVAVIMNHSILLREQFARTGSQSALNEAIAITRRAIDATLAGTQLHFTSRYNLATLLKAQFDRSGDLPALAEAIDIIQSTLDVVPRDHADIPLYRTTLVGSLCDYAKRTGDLATLNRAISTGYDAIEATPANHPNLVASLSNLAVALRAKGERLNDPAAVADAVDVLRKAASIATGHARGPVLTNLANSLRMSFEMTRDSTALDEAIDIARAAVAHTVEDHSDTSTFEFNLALALSLATDRPDHLREAVELMATAATRTTARPAVRVDAAKQWGRLALQAGQPEYASRGFAMAVQLLPLLAARGLVRTDARHWMAQHSQLAGDAAACALSAGNPGLAVELLEMGRGVLLAQTLESRTDLSDLRDEHPVLADSFVQLCSRLDQEGSQDPQLDGRREQAAELTALIAHVRTLPGLERFLQPPDIALLTAQASDGPIIIVNVSEYRSDALILTTTGVVVQELPGLDHETVVDQFDMMSRGTSTGHATAADQDAEQTMHEMLEWLWDSVAGPVLERLGLTRPAGDHATPQRIWWVPCGPIAYFPLHAAGGLNRSALDFVISSYTPTVRALAQTRARPVAARSKPKVLAVGMPQTPDSTDLPAVWRELRSLGNAIPRLTAVIAADATHDAVLDRLPGYEWAHFSCHAATDPADPAGSYLLVHDHAHKPLRVLDISRLHLDTAEFAYLSACNTAVTTPDLVNESIHIVTAFQLAGYRHVIGTLWEVNDAVAALIAGRVYAGLAANDHAVEHAATCLHQAVRMVRDRYPRRPALWAAHVHVGA